MKLDAAVLRYLKRDDFRVLTAIEMGMKNHELVPTPLICTIAGLSAGPGAAFKIINTLHRNKLIYHENKTYDGYRLTYLGYDYLALRTYVARGLISGLGRRIGVGKEADIYECINDAGEKMVLKIHRLGRISFRQIKNKRDYLLHRKNASWMYMSRLAAIREWTFLKALFEHGFPVPTPYDQSRHTILMSFVEGGIPFGQVRQIAHTGRVYSSLLNLIVRLAEHGLIHADFNEFNLLIDEEDGERITLIDFPQMVSTSHPDAKMFFERDVGCIVRYFRKRFGYDSGEYPSFEEDGAPNETKKIDLDKELAASGHNAAANFCSKEQQQEFERYIGGKTDAAAAAAAAKAAGADEDAEQGEDDEEDQEEEDDVDEEELAASLGVDASDLAEHGDGATVVREDEAAALSAQLLADEAALENDAAAAAAAAGSNKKKKKGGNEKARGSSAAAAEEPVDEDDEEEEEDEEDDSHRAERMARKDARKTAMANKQRMQQQRKADEKARKAREREIANNPELAKQVAAEKAAAAAAAAASAPPAAAAPALHQSEDDEVAAAAGAGSDDDVDFDDTRSVASQALSHLSTSTGSVLNIKLRPQQQGHAVIKLKQTNKNKGREMKKVYQTIKEHM